MSLVLDALVVVGGLALGRWIGRSVRNRRSRAVPSKPPEAPPPIDAFAALPCRLGDVVVRVLERDEAWLAGALVFEEDHPVAALFVAPEAGGDRAVFVDDAPGATLTWLSPMTQGDAAVTAEPPHVLEHEGAILERARRLPVRVVRLGSGAPTIGERAVLAEYGGPGTQRILVVAGAEKTLAWKGVALVPREYDVLPGSETSPDP